MKNAFTYDGVEKEIAIAYAVSGQGDGLAYFKLGFLSETINYDESTRTFFGEGDSILLFLTSEGETIKDGTYNFSTTEGRFYFRRGRFTSIIISKLKMGLSLKLQEVYLKLKQWTV